MAHIYVGDKSRVDEEVLECIKNLPDDFWIFAEFNIGRNVDWFIARAVPETSHPHLHSTLIVTELKRTQKSLDGSVDSTWKYRNEVGEWQELRPSNQEDLNPYWQAVNTANTLAQWLWNNQQRYRQEPDIRSQDEFKVWPDLLILSPPGTTHSLPMQPPSRYGQWWYRPESWVNHLKTWNPKLGVPLTARHLQQLADALHLAQIDSELTERPRYTRPAMDFALWLEDLENRVSRLEQELSR